MLSDVAEIEQHGGEYRLSLPPTVERYAACQKAACAVVDRSELRYLAWKLDDLLNHYRDVRATRDTVLRRYKALRGQSKQSLDAQRAILDRSARQLHALGPTFSLPVVPQPSGQ
jgi:hypothetical protein